MQAAVELRPTDGVLHVDVIDAYPSVDRGLMLNEVYGDTRLRHMWRSFDFNFGQPSVVLVRVGDRVVHSSVSDNGVPRHLIRVMSNNPNKVTRQGSSPGVCLC
jgi:hypothetical protein